MESRAALLHVLGLEVKGQRNAAVWADTVQKAYEAKIRACRGDADQCEDLEHARSVLLHEECYALYEQIWCGPNLYTVLGLRPGCAPVDIKKGYRETMRKSHVDKRHYDCARLRAQATMDSQRVGRAYDVLSNHRTDYDVRKSFDFNPQQPESDDGEDVGFQFDPDMWAASGSECEEAPPGYDAEQEARRSQRKRKPRQPRQPRQPRKPRSAGSKRRRRAPRAGDGEPPPQEPVVTTQRVVLTCTLRDLYRGLRRRFVFAKGFKNGADAEWFNRNTTIDLGIPERTAPGVFQVLKGYGQFNHRTQSCDDLEIVIEASTASCFTVEGPNLVRTVEVDLATALTGGGFAVELPDGTEARCDFGDMLRSGDRRVVPGKRGLRTAGGGYGDVVCEVKVVYGEWSSRQRRALATVLRAIRSDDPAVRTEMMNRVAQDARRPEGGAFPF